MPIAALTDHPQPTGQVWFLTIRIADAVHDGAAGFTHVIHRFTASAACHDEAEDIGKRWAIARGLTPTKITSAPAIPTGKPYVFPEQFLDVQLRRMTGFTFQPQPPTHQ